MYFLRMNEKIMRWPSAQFYQGKLIAAPSVANLSLSDLGNKDYIQGVPKKTLISVQRLLEVLKSDLQIKKFGEF